MKANSLLNNGPQAECALVEFRRLPLGAHFTFQGMEGVYVVLRTDGCGLIAAFSNELDHTGQMVLSAADTEEEASRLMVSRFLMAPSSVQMVSSHLNDKKANAIAERDHFVATGYVMTHADGRMCIANGGAIRWFSDKQFFDMMHPAAMNESHGQAESAGEYRSVRERILSRQPVECQTINDQAVEIDLPLYGMHHLPEAVRTIAYDKFHALVDVACTKLQVEEQPKEYWDGVGAAMEEILAAVAERAIVAGERDQLAPGETRPSPQEMHGIVLRLREIGRLLGIESALPSDDVLQESIFAALGMIRRAIEGMQPGSPTFQARVQPWLLACFGQQVAGDKVERNHRLLEEALELVQACGCSQQDAHALVDYTFSRPVGEPAQEVGGVMVTLAALCLANELDMHKDGEVELSRVWTKIDKIRAKQAAKPRGSPLPIDIAILSEK